MLTFYRPQAPKPWSLLSPPAGLAAPPSPELQSINAERLREDRLAVDGLAATSLLSVAVGTLGALRTKRARARAFHLTSAGVHLFVLGTAVVGRAAIEVHDPATLGTQDSVQSGARLLRLLSAGIVADMAAMLGGVLASRVSRRRSETLRGAGASLLLHGTMLLLIDTALFLRNAYQQQRVLQCVGSA